MRFSWFGTCYYSGKFGNFFLTFSGICDFQARSKNRFCNYRFRCPRRSPSIPRPPKVSKGTQGPQGLLWTPRCPGSRLRPRDTTVSKDSVASVDSKVP